MDLMATVGVELDPNQTPEQVRATIEQFGAAAPPGQACVRVEDRDVPGPDGDVPVRVYWPADDAGLPVLVWYHGGGWTLGNLETADRNCRALANAAGCIVVSVDYRLAPEHRFPAAVEVEYESPSMRENGAGYFLTQDALRWFYGHYLGDADPHQWQVSPLLAPDLTGVPPALVITAEYDPLRDQGMAYAARLADAGVAVDAKMYEGVFHGFFGMQDAIDVARDALDDATAALRAAFAA